MKINLSLLYIYLFSAVGLIFFLIGTVNLFQVGLDTYLTKNTTPMPYYDKVDPATGKALTLEQIETNRKEATERDRQYKQDARQQKIINAIPMVLVGLPLYLYHWRKSQQYA